MRGLLNGLVRLRVPLLLLGLIIVVFGYLPIDPIEPIAPDRVFAQGYSNTNPYAYFVPPGACNSTVSANSTGTQGLTTSGASTMPVVAAQTSATGATNTHTFICNISPPYAIITTGNGIGITDAVFFYGVSAGGGIGSAQVATLASGTFMGCGNRAHRAYFALGALPTRSICLITGGR